MAAESDTGCVEKRFGHCIINWKIENYCLVTCRKKWIINSPEFYVRGSQTTKWKMILKPKSNLDVCFYTTLYLQRIYSNSEPDIVRANWRLTFMYKLGKESKLYHVKECEYDFAKESNYGVDLANILITFKRFVPLDQDTLYIRCQLIVSHEDESRQFDILSNTELRSLSQDLKALCEISDYQNIVIKTDDKELAAHKAVLYARNRTFADLIDQAKDNTPIIVRLNHDAVEKVIAFLYSGDLQFLLSKPSIALYECIMHLKIEEITSYYSPDEFILNTTVDVQDFVFRWSITDFSNKTEDCITSTIFNKGIFETFRILQLKMKRQDEFQYISFRTKLAKDAKPVKVYIEFSVMNNNQEIISLGRVTKSVQGSEVISSYDYDLSELFENSFLLVDNTLHVFFKLRISESKEVSSVGCQLVSFTSKAERQYRSLSRDMARLWELGKFQDIILQAGELSFRAHKCVLASRSRVFAAKIDEMPKKHDVIVISDWSSKAFRTFLYYIYCGVLKDFEIWNILEVYSAAHFFEISTLKDTCSSILQSSIELESAWSILMFADSANDIGLKLSTLKFIFRNTPAIFKQRGWKSIITENPPLKTEVINYIKKSNHDELVNRNSKDKLWILEQPCIHFTL